MPQCLFCLQKGEGDSIRFTDEHVFPAALSGNLVVKDGTREKCNHGNSKFEQALAVELTPIRTMPMVNGFQAAREINKQIPETAIAILSSHADKYFVAEAKKVGVRAYVPKSKIGQALVEALEAAVKGYDFIFLE